MAFINKMVDVPTAVKHREKFNKSCINVTTNDYFFNKPVYAREMMANSSRKVNMTMFSRLLPMENPAYARCMFVNRAFFVPYRVIFPQFNRFLSQEKTENGAIITKVHTLFQTTIFEAFKTDAQGVQYFGKTVQSTQPYDLMYLPWDSQPEDAVYIKFSKRGKVAYDTLINLGYNIPDTYALTPDIQENDWNVEFSALPLLAFAKIHVDYYRNNKYEPIINNQYMEAFFNLQSPISLTAQNLIDILLFVTEISYPIDYFTSASVRPVSPAIGEANQVMEDPTLPASSISSVRGTVRNDRYNADGTPVISKSSSSTDSNAVITDWILKAINKMTDYLQRDGLVGGKTLDRLLVHYGVRLESEQLKRSVYLGKYVQPIMIMDVTQTSPQTNNSPDSGGKTSVLGYQAGRGITASDAEGHFDFETKEFGHFIIISQLVPEVSYFQGVDREMLHVSRFSFFTPEYDCLGPQSIAKCEIYNGPQDLQDNHEFNLWYHNKWDENFGFAASRYMEYKVSRDKMSGDFRVTTAGRVSLRSYHQFREIDQTVFGSDYIIQTNKRFDTVNADLAQYDRIFNNQSSFDDHFISFYNFEVTDYLPARQAFEGYDFGDDEAHRLHRNVQKGGTMF